MFHEHIPTTTVFFEGSPVTSAANTGWDWTPFTGLRVSEILPVISGWNCRTAETDLTSSYILISIWEMSQATIGQFICYYYTIIAIFLYVSFELLR